MAFNQDLFSLLPESLLITILSLLPLKDAVRTSILAKGWRNLWRLRTDFEINERYFCSLHNTGQHQDNVLEMQDLKKFQQISCIKFGYGWLGSQESLSSISSFSMTFSNPRDYHIHMDRFISSAILRQTKSLELDFSCLNWEDKLPISDRSTYGERFDLPEFVYQHGSSLESLKLVSCNFRGDNLMNLSCALKNVSLGWIGFTNMSHLTNFVRNCPLLESLSLSKCFNLTIYVIESNSLKTLVINKCVDLLNLAVFTPKLLCFKYFGELVNFGFINFPYMEVVDLDFDPVGMIDEEQSDKIVSLLNIFQNARSLTICAYTTQVLSLARDGLRLRSSRVRNLTIRTSFYESEFSGILLLLDSYPSLENLQFEIGQRTHFKDDLENYFGLYPPKTLKPSIRDGCVTKKLKFVEIQGFRGIKYDEFKIVFFLIRYGCALQEVVLKVGNNDHAAKADATWLKETLRQQRPGLKVEVLS